MTTTSPEGFASPVPAGLLSRSIATAAGPDSAAFDLAFAAHHAPFAAGRQGVPGIDYAWTKPGIPAIKAAGDVFVAQYFSPDAAKNLTPARAHDLLAAGIKIVVVWEFGAKDALRGKAGGQRDATAADAQAKACGIAGIPIYWAIDYDEPPGDQGTINDYARGWTDVLGMDRGGNAYGGYWPLSRLKSAGLIKRLWGTPAWSGDNWSHLTPDIMQGAMINVGGVQCDLDAGLSADFGYYPRPPTSSARWQWHTCSGNESLAGVIRKLNGQLPRSLQLRPAEVLRMTAQKNGGRWDAAGGLVGDWLNEVLGDPGADPHTAIKAGAKLWVLAP